MSLTNVFQRSAIKSKIICKYFIKGICRKGEKCPYLHSQIFTSKDLSEGECPMYSIGYCKNGPVCKFAHIKKDKYSENEEEGEEEQVEMDEEVKKEGEEEEEEKIKEKKNEEDEDATSSTPLAEDFINESEIEKEDKKNNNNINNLSNKNNNDKNEKNENINNQEKNINKNKDKEEDFNFHLIPIWYLEHYYAKPILVIFSELESKNLPEVISLQKKYGFSNNEQHLSMVQPSPKKNNFNMNTLNLNFNNVNMNFGFNHHPFFQNQIYPDLTRNSNYNNFPYSYLYPYSINKENIEYILNQENNIYYYLIKFKKYKTIKKSYESSIIKLPEILFNKYKDIDLINNNLTIIIIIYNSEYDEFVGFAKLQYPIIRDNDENENKKTKNVYKIEWLWKNRINYSEIGNLMNKADNTNYLNEENGCQIDNDLGNSICRLMTEKPIRQDYYELINEKEKKVRQNLKNNKIYQYDYENYYDDYQYNDEYYYNDYQYNDVYYYDDYNYDNKYYNDYKGEIDYKYYNIRLFNNKRRDKHSFKYKNKFEDYKYNLEKIHQQNKHTKHKLKHNKIDEIKINKNKSKRHEKRSRSRSRSRSRKRRRSYKSYSFSNSDERRYYKRKESDEHSNYYKYKKLRQKEKKIYSQVNEEYNIPKQ